MYVWEQAVILQEQKVLKCGKDWTGALAGGCTCKVVSQDREGREWMFDCVQEDRRL